MLKMGDENKDGNKVCFDDWRAGWNYKNMHKCVKTIRFINGLVNRPYNTSMLSVC